MTRRARIAGALLVLTLLASQVWAYQAWDCDWNDRRGFYHEPIMIQVKCGPGL